MDSNSEELTLPGRLFSFMEPLSTHLAFWLRNVLPVKGSAAVRVLIAYQDLQVSRPGRELHRHRQPLDDPGPLGHFASSFRIRFHPVNSPRSILDRNTKATKDISAGGMKFSMPFILGIGTGATAAVDCRRPALTAM
jgi:hypothetical protein